MSCKHCGSDKTVKGRRVCGKCLYKARKEANPYRLSYTRLRGHAKARGKEFNLTFEQFTEFCIASNYLNCKGIKKESYHIDRIDENKGYTIDNIQLLTNIENVRKYINFVTIDENGKKVFKTNKETKLSNIEFDTPF